MEIFFVPTMFSHMVTLFRAIYLSPDSGLGVEGSCSGDVCEQPSQRTDHLCWTDPAEPMVGTQWFCWHFVCYNFCPHPWSEQVFSCSAFTFCCSKCLSEVSVLHCFSLRGAIANGLYGYNGILVGLLMAVFSNAGDWYWWLLLPNIFMSMAW